MVMPTSWVVGPGHMLILYFLLLLVSVGREFGFMALKSALVLLQFDLMRRVVLGGRSQNTVPLLFQYII